MKKYDYLKLTWMGQLNSRKTVIVRNSRFYHNSSIFEFFRAIFLGCLSCEMGAYLSLYWSTISPIMRMKLTCYAIPFKFVRNCLLFRNHFQVLKKYKFGQFMFSARQYQSSMTKQPWWLKMINKTTQWASRKGIIKNCYNLLQENRERTPPWVDTFKWDKKSQPIFTNQIFKLLYLPQHLIAIISIASPSWTDIAMWALRWSGN